jgi:Tetrapyrrole (Corrin/Porphyrin) Methylases
MWTELPKNFSQPSILAANAAICLTLFRVHLSYLFTLRRRHSPHPSGPASAKTWTTLFTSRSQRSEPTVSIPEHTMESLSTTPITTATKQGTLIIAGSGIASIAHITLETVLHLKEAEKVYYVICDPATEAFIQDNAKVACFDLSVFYDTEKCRYDTYIQMCEAGSHLFGLWHELIFVTKIMLRDVRAGHDVLGIFYGHPGIFVSPTHRAIAIAREEGYKARMLPGISAEDVLFADLGVDPAINGCATYEATELIMRDRVLNPSVHNIIWQVGGVGVITMVFNASTYHLATHTPHFGSFVSSLWY